MPMHALSARALNGGFCAAGANQNRLLRRPVPLSVAETRGSEGLKYMYGLGERGPCQCTP